ncbi:MAG: hypothetical protein LBD03_05010 [Methanobrevibacter sp.]|jgi:restriction endonuclease S subunit|nr:hypothetical protein [Candidatus Methanovirga procula]
MKTTNEVKLGEIAKVSSGMFTKRYDAENSKNNDFPLNYYKTISNKSVEENYINENLFENLSTDRDIDSKYIAKENDIIMKLSPPYNVSIIDFKKNYVIVPLNFAIIRLKKDVEFFPMYLSYLLNSYNIRKQLSRLVEGSGIQVMKISHVKEIKVKKIAISKQKKYAKLFSLLNERKKLMKRKFEVEEILSENIINQLNN